VLTGSAQIGVVTGQGASAETHFGLLKGTEIIDIYKLLGAESHIMP